MGLHIDLRPGRRLRAALTPSAQLRTTLKEILHEAGEAAITAVVIDLLTKLAPQEDTPPERSTDA